MKNPYSPLAMQGMLNGLAMDTGTFRDDYSDRLAPDRNDPRPSGIVHSFVPSFNNDYFDTANI